MRAGKLWTIRLTLIAAAAIGGCGRSDTPVTPASPGALFGSASYVAVELPPPSQLSAELTVRLDPEALTEIDALIAAEASSALGFGEADPRLVAAAWATLGSDRLSARLAEPDADAAFFMPLPQLLPEGVGMTRTTWWRREQALLTESPMYVRTDEAPLPPTMDLSWDTQLAPAWSLRLGYSRQYDLPEDQPTRPVWGDEAATFQLKLEF